MSIRTPRHTVRRGAKAAAVIAVTGAFVASIATAASAAPDLRAIVESTLSSGTETTSTIITTTSETSTTSETTTSETTTSATTPPPAPSAEVYADLYVELDAPLADRDGDYHSGPMVFSATDRLVGPGPELTGADLTANPSDYCGDISVDVSLDPATITVTGGQEYCDFGSAYLRIMLHGATFGAVTLTGDDLFGDVYYEEEPPGDEQLDQASGFAGSGSFGASLPIMTAIIDRPTLQSYGATGDLFTARWEGLMWSDMSGTASFTFVRGATGPVFAAADPVFTG